MTLSPKTAVPAAIYCHALWRTGSTSLFNAFRADPRFMCFYEPLHEGLRTLTEKKADRFDPEDVQRMGHNGLTQPYFHEYRDLVRHRRGVPAFPAHLSYGDFFNVSAAARAELESYFRVLSDLAWSQGKVPVFCLNRSWGRMRAFKEIAPDAIHVFSLRDPQATWASFQKRRSYFFAKLLLICSKSDPGLMQRAFPEFSNLSLIEKLRTDRTFKRKVRGISDERIAPLFWHSYASALVNGVLNADYIIDLEHFDAIQDDRIVLAHDLSALSCPPSSEPLKSRLCSLADSHKSNHINSKTLANPPVSRPTSPVPADVLCEAACRAAPKLSLPNRKILAGLIAPQGRNGDHSKRYIERTSKQT